MENIQNYGLDAILANRNGDAAIDMTDILLKD
jgi:hypothetical protein